MRDILSKATMGAMIAGAALLVTACGDTDTAANNAAANELTTDGAYDPNAMEMDLNGMDANMTNGVDAALDNAAAATDNAADAIENAQDATR